MRFAVIATGPSLTDAQVQAVRHLPCVAVSNAYEKAPWALALASADLRWWNHYRPDFAGRRFSVSHVPDAERVDLVSGSNSGLLGLEVAVRLGATSILLLGFDMHGSHYFGPHQGLKNTDRIGFERFKRQLGGFKKVPVVNCTPGSALECFPKMDLACALKLP
jgi:hypothetical protein